MGETYTLGDSPLVLLTALTSAYDPNPVSSLWVDRPRPRILGNGLYGEPGEGPPIRVFTRIDVRLLLEDLAPSSSCLPRCGHEAEVDTSGSDQGHRRGSVHQGSPSLTLVCEEFFWELEVVPMRVVVDFDLCESNALCMGLAPEVFEVRDDDLLYVLDENPPEELREKIQAAVRTCPKNAISIED
jgi:ferredoxin